MSLGKSEVLRRGMARQEREDEGGVGGRSDRARSWSWRRRSLSEEQFLVVLFCQKERSGLKEDREEPGGHFKFLKKAAMHL